MPDMGVDILKNNLTNPARTYLWEVIIPNPIGGGDSNTLLVRCQSSNIPGRSFGEILVPYKQTGGVKFPGKLTYDHTWDCVFIEGEDKKIFDAIYGWNQKVVNDYDGVGEGDDAIKSDIVLTLITTKGQTFQKIKLVGCYPQAVGPVALAYDGTDPVRYTVTFSFDRWENVA